MVSFVRDIRMIKVVFYLMVEEVDLEINNWRKNDNMLRSMNLGLWELEGRGDFLEEMIFEKVL